MIVELPWGSEFLTIDLPDNWNIHLPERIDISGGQKPDEIAIVDSALSNPIATGRLSDKDLTGKKILIVVDDNTRPTPTGRFFHLLIDHLEAAGADTGNIHVLTALGIHTAMDENDMAVKIGAHNLEKIQWSNHDAFSPESLHRFGTTNRGTPVILNKKVAECDMILLVGMIEPHLWAGFGGGMKNLFPGVAAAEAIGNHHGMIAAPPYWFNRVGVTPEENEFRRDIEEMQSFVDAEIFLVNVLLDENQQIAAAFAGHPIDAHRKGIEFSRKAAGIFLDEPVDAVIVNSHPMDINFKQSMKCVGNALPALKPGGIVMAFLRAERGLDDIPLPKKPPPLLILKSILKLIGKSNVLSFLELVKKGLNVEEKFLAYYSMRLIQEFNLFCYVPMLTEDEVRHLGFFQSFQSPAEVINKGRQKLKSGSRVAVFPDGGATFPIIKSSGQ